MNNTIIIAILFLVLVVILAALKPKYMSGRKTFLLRALFPSWRFFEEVTELPTIFVRLKKGEKFDKWRTCMFTPKRSFHALFFNPEANLLFAYGGLLQHLTQDLETAEDAESFMTNTSYKLAENLVRYELVRSGKANKGGNFQFKICTAMQGDEKNTLDDVLISATHKV